MPENARIRRALRRSICARCIERPAGSEQWSADRPRPCETACQVFVFLASLKQLAREPEPPPHAEPVASLPLACAACNLKDDTGHCAAHHTGACPLCRYSDRVLQTVRSNLHDSRTEG